MTQCSVDSAGATGAGRLAAFPGPEPSVEVFWTAVSEQTKSESLSLMDDYLALAVQVCYLLIEHETSTSRSSLTLAFSPQSTMRGCSQTATPTTASQGSPAEKKKKTRVLTCDVKPKSGMASTPTRLECRAKRRRRLAGLSVIAYRAPSQALVGAGRSGLPLHYTVLAAGWLRQRDSRSRTCKHHVPPSKREPPNRDPSSRGHQTLNTSADIVGVLRKQPRGPETRLPLAWTRAGREPRFLRRKRARTRRGLHDIESWKVPLGMTVTSGFPDNDQCGRACITVTV